MTKPNRFILSTDFATLQNDASGTITFTLAGSLSIPPLTTYTENHSITIGTQGAVSRSFINNSASPTQWFFGSSLETIANGTYSGGPFPGPTSYECTIALVRTDSTTLTANVSIPGDYSPGIYTLTTESTPRTITILVNTFLAPFPA